MNIIYIGAGFVGTCSAAVAADSGHNVLVFDIDETKIKKLGSGEHAQIESCLYEEGLADLLTRNRERISFTHTYADVETFLDTADAVFMCVQTPEKGETGESDLKYYNIAMNDLADALVKRNNGAQEQYVVVINKSTVPINMVDHTAEILESKGVKQYGVASNPEFLVEGKAILGSLKPDRVVVGAWEQKDFEIMREVYRRFYASPTVDYIEVNPKEAAAGKLLANFYLFSKLALCFDVIGRTSEAFEDIQFENLRKILTTESRIGNWGFFDSLYAGGSCFIKDARSLAHQLKEADQDPVFVREVHAANERQLTHFIDRAEQEAGVAWKDKKVALLGTAFKRSTNDVRNSASIALTKHMLKEGVAEIRAYDPKGMPMYCDIFTDSDEITVAESVQNAIVDADIIIITTDWPEFAQITPFILERTTPVLLLDGRRMLHPKYNELVAAGHSVLAVGSPLMKP